MLTEKMSIQLVSKLTKLSVEEVSELQNTLFAQEDEETSHAPISMETDQSGSKPPEEQ